MSVSRSSEVNHYRSDVRPDGKNDHNLPLDLVDITWHLGTILLHLTCVIYIWYKERPLEGSQEPLSRIVIGSLWSFLHKKMKIFRTGVTWVIHCFLDKWICGLLEWSIQDDKSGIQSASGWSSKGFTAEVLGNVHGFLQLCEIRNSFNISRHQERCEMHLRT